VALGLSAIETGVRLLPLSVTLLAAATLIPRFFPMASPRLVVRIGLAALLIAAATLLATLDTDAGPEIILAPMLLTGFGIGALASQLGAVTVSAVPDERSPEVGGLQNTATNLGASLGTALAGSILIASLTTSFLTSIENNPDVPEEVKQQAELELYGGVPFISDDDLEAALDEAGVSDETAAPITEAYEESRIEGLENALALLALLAAVALLLTGVVPNQQPRPPTDDAPAPTTA
jgi:hypothetical protein